MSFFEKFRTSDKMEVTRARRSHLIFFAQATRQQFGQEPAIL